MRITIKMSFFCTISSMAITGRSMWLVILTTLLIWNLPSTSFGIEGLTVVQQRIIAIFAFATLAWVLEVVPAWATSVAVIGLLLINTIALKYLNDPEGLNLNIGFGEWMMFMFPLVIVLLLFSWFIIKKLYPFTQKTIELKIEGELKHNFKTKVVIVTFIFTVALWLLDSVSGINSYTVALVPFVIFSLTGVIDRRDLEEINWSVIWMVAGGFALGYALNGSGLAKQAVSSIPFGDFSPLAILVLACLICYALSNFISNSATAALLMPILTVVCLAMGDKLDVIGGTSTVLISVAVAASSAMVLPISTPPNALAFATNLISQKDMARIGLIIGIVSMVLGISLLYLLGTMHII